MITNILAKFRWWHPSTQVPAPVADCRQASIVRAVPPETSLLVYPPVDPGLPAIPVDSFNHHPDLIARLRDVAGVKSEHFDQRYLAAIRGVAEYIHLLPASAFEQFSGPGGLYRQCVEMALFSAQAAHGRIFTAKADVEERHRQEPLWKYAAFLTGLLCELYKPLSRVVVVDPSGEAWPKYLGPLSNWLRDRNADRYFVLWPASSGPSSGGGGEAGPVITHAIPRDALQWLDQSTPEISREMFSVVLGQTRDGSGPLAEMIGKVREGVLKRDAATRRSRYGRLMCGSHIEPYLVDVARAKVEAGEWRVNQDGPVWFGSDGIYTEWPRCYSSMREAMADAAIGWMPTSPYTAAEMLGRGGALLQMDDGGWIWKIITSEGEVKTALRWREAQSVLGMHECKPLDRPFADYLVRRIQETEDGPGGKKAQEAPAAQADTPPEHGGRRQPVKTAPSAPPAPTQLEIPADIAQPSVHEQGEEVRFESYLSEAARRLLNAKEAEIFGRIVKAVKAGDSDDIRTLEWGVIVSRDWLEGVDVDVNKFLAMLERKLWLGHLDGASRGAKINELPFLTGKKWGVTLNNDCCAKLGMRGSAE